MARFAFGVVEVLNSEFLRTKVIGRRAVYRQLASTRRGSLAFGKYHLHTADRPASQAHLDAVRVRGRIGENLVNGSFCQDSGTLILFLYDLHPGSRGDVGSVSPVHWSARA